MDGRKLSPCAAIYFCGSCGENRVPQLKHSQVLSGLNFSSRRLFSFMHLPQNLVLPVVLCQKPPFSTHRAQRRGFFDAAIQNLNAKYTAHKMASSSAISSNRVFDLVAIAVQIESPNLAVRAVHSNADAPAIPPSMCFNSFSGIMV